MQPSNLTEQWIELAKQHDGNDRWYLESLGIAAEGHWDKCLELLAKAYSDKQISKAAYQDLVWRSRGQQTASMLAVIIDDKETSEVDALRYFRAFDFIKSLEPEGATAANMVLKKLGFKQRDTDAKSRVIFREATSRIEVSTLSAEQTAYVDQVLANIDDHDFVSLALKFGNEERDKKLMRIALENFDNKTCLLYTSPSPRDS